MEWLNMYINLYYVADLDQSQSLFKNIAFTSINELRTILSLGQKQVLTAAPK